MKIWIEKKKINIINYYNLWNLLELNKLEEIEGQDKKNGVWDFNAHNTLVDGERMLKNDI